MEVTIENESQRNARRLSPTRNLIAGSIGGMFACVVGQPLDMVKVRLQVMSNVQPGQTPPFKGPLDCLLKIVKADGIRGLFRGMLSPILIATPGTALSFYSLSLGKRLQLDNPNQEPTLVQYMNAGIFCGFCIAFLYCPAERIKCLLQVQQSSGVTKKVTPLEVLQNIFRAEGFQGVYRGLGVTMTRELFGNGIWYLTYESILKFLRPTNSTRDDVSLASIVIAGGAAGLAYWGVAYPIDVLKTRYQVAPVGLYPQGGRDILRVVFQGEGIKALYKGYVPTLVRAPIVHIALFLGYEFTLKTLNRFFP